MSAARAALSQSRSSADLVFVALCASLLWAVSLPDIDLGRMTDLGLVSVIPPSLVLALGALTVSFCICLHHARNPVVLLLHVVALIVMLYGVTTLVADVPRFNVAWRHIGVADYIGRTGAVDPGIDVYFNWPGFFIASSFASDLTGISLPSLANWAPVALNLLYLGPLLMILRTATSDQRLVWLAIWFFYLTNWVGQDYFSPQGAAYFLYLVVLAVLLRWFSSVPERRFRLRRRHEHTAQAAVRAQEPSGERAALMLIVIVIFAAMVATHQLTPFVMVASVGSLVLARRCSARGLPGLMAVLIGIWIAFLAVSYVTGHIDGVIADLGNLGKSVDSTSSRVQGSAEHLLVIRARMLLTLFIWALAALGALRAFRAGRREVGFGLLAIVPFSLMGFQPYGGEIMLRIYLFALPFVAFFAASLFYASSEAGRSWRTTRAVLLVSLVLLAGFAVARYGNERMDQFSRAELEAVNRLYAVAPPGALLVAGDANLPWRFRNYETYDYQLVTKTDSWKRINWARPKLKRVVREVKVLMEDSAKRGAFLIFTRSQRAGVEVLGLSPPGALRSIDRNVDRSPAFRLVYRNRDAAIYMLAASRKGAT